MSSVWAQAVIRKLPLALLLLTLGGIVMAYQEPKYQVVGEYDGFELRRYAPQIVAEAVVAGDFEDVGNLAFKILAGYIGGKNLSKAEINMTAPVNQVPVSESGEKIAMTVPVTQKPDRNKIGSYRFAFFMPSEYALDELPIPNDPRVQLRRIETRLIAARTYSGTWSKKRYRQNEQALIDGIAEAGLEPIGAPHICAIQLALHALVPAQE